MISDWCRWLGELLGFMDVRCRMIRRHVTLMACILVTGTLFYGRVEGLATLDAAYFSIVTLATVGYGDISPQTNLGRAFTAVYLVFGVVVHLSFAASLVAHKHRLGCGCPPLATENSDADAIDDVANLRYLADGGNIVPFGRRPAS